ncbi:MAG TPA: acyltransferase, partial [Chryseosolibacter sp.]|nr:acyltransferase [Chryseosolibacter sp.]
YLRGLCALSIMVYHYFSWSFGEYDASTFLGRIGIYGVSIFYILSGLTLYLVYEKGLSVSDFYIKRFFRIYPLLWVIITLTIIVNDSTHSLYELLVNYTGMFGVLAWDMGIGTGVWSIGNELSFYLMFPVLSFMAKNNVRLYIAISVLILCIYFGFAFYMITDQSISKQRDLYVHPLNQAGLFVIGVLMGRFLKRVSINRWANLFILVFALLAFIYYPVEGDRAKLLISYNRVVFTLISAAICLTFYKMDFQIKVIHKPLSWLGEACYSVYLLNPITWLLMMAVFKQLHFPTSPTYMVPLCMGITIVLSLIVYRTYERFFVQLGKHIIRWRAASRSAAS